VHTGTQILAAFSFIENSKRRWPQRYSIASTIVAVQARQDQDGF
jgi:hypothetical protein